MNQSGVTSSTPFSYSFFANDLLAYSQGMHAPLPPSSSSPGPISSSAAQPSYPSAAPPSATAGSTSTAPANGTIKSNPSHAAQRIPYDRMTMGGYNTDFFTEEPYITITTSNAIRHESGPERAAQVAASQKISRY